MTAPQLLALPFRLGLDQRYGHCVKNLDLSKLSTLDAITVISAFGRLPNVRHVVAPEAPLVRNRLRAMLVHDIVIHSDHGLYIASADAAMDALWTFLSRVPSIEAREERVLLSTVKELADRENALVELRIELWDEFDKVDMLKVLIGFPKLRHLDVTTARDLAWDVPLSWTSREIAEPLATLRRVTRLERLILSASSEGFSALAAFVCAFQATLVDLEIEFASASHWGGDFDLEVGTRFAKLERIRLVGEEEACSGVLARVRSNEFPSLRHIEVEVRRDRASSFEKNWHMHWLVPVLETFDGRQPPLTVTTSCHSSRTRFQSRSCDRLPYGTWPVSEVPQGETLSPPTILQDPLGARSLVARPPRNDDNDDNDDDGEDGGDDDLPSNGVAEELRATAGEVLLPLLDGMRSMVEGAEVTGDFVQLTRIARALQGCEYLWLQQRM